MRRYVLEFDGRTDQNTGNKLISGSARFANGNASRAILVPINIFPSALLVELSQLCDQSDMVQKLVDYETPTVNETTAISVANKSLGDLNLLDSGTTLNNNNNGFIVKKS